MGITGTTQLFGIIELLQIAELNRRSYAIRLTRPGEEGAITLVDGVLLYATAGPLAGREALAKLCEWPESQIEIAPVLSATTINIAEDKGLLVELALEAAGRQKRPAPSAAWRINGGLDVMPAGEMLEIFELNHLPVLVRLASDKGTALVYLFDGEALHATFSPSASFTGKADLSPEAVIFEALAWTGRFEAAIAETLPERTVAQPLSTLILEGASQAQERQAFPKERVTEEQALADKTLKEVQEGKASASVRRLAAKRYLPRGRTAPVDTLLNLSLDQDKGVSGPALDSIARLPFPVLKTLAGDSQTPDAILRHLVHEFWNDDDLMRPLAENPSASEETLGLLASFASDAVLGILTKDAARLARSEAIRNGVHNRGDRAAKLRRKQEMDKRKHSGGSIHKRILDMSVPDKVFLAYRGSASERAILAQHPLRMVAIAVLQSPKITDGEIASLASMKSINQDVLEGIAGTPTWVNQYPIARALTTNPKTPAHIGIDLLKRMRENDLRLIYRDRNLPEGVRASAGRRLQLMEKKKGL